MTEPSLPSRKWMYIVGVIAFGIVAIVAFQLSSIKDEQQKLALENARLSGIAEAHSQTLASHETKMVETAKQISETKDQVTEQANLIQQNTDMIQQNTDELAKQNTAIAGIKKQVKNLQDTPATDVVIAATDDAAKQEAFNNWAKHHPEWKQRRSCMKNQMNENPKVTLTEAYNACG